MSLSLVCEGETREGGGWGVGAKEVLKHFHGNTDGEECLGPAGSPSLFDHLYRPRDSYVYVVSLKSD